MAIASVLSLRGATVGGMSSDLDPPVQTQWQWTGGKRKAVDWLWTENSSTLRVTNKPLMHSVRSYPVFDLFLSRHVEALCLCMPVNNVIPAE